MRCTWSYKGNSPLGQVSPSFSISRNKESFEQKPIALCERIFFFFPSDYVSRLGGEVGENYKLGEDEKKKLTMLEAVMWEGSVKDNVLRPSADNKPSFMN